MIRLGVVAAGPAVRIADGTQASAGDLILCTRNNHPCGRSWQAGPFGKKSLSIFIRI
jgi:hypothetical protein